MLFLRVGRYVELYGAQRLLAMQVLGLRPARIARLGYALTVGFPRRHEALFVQRCLYAGFGVLRLASLESATDLLVPKAGVRQGAMEGGVNE